MTRDTPCGTILVVDDNLDIRAFAKRFLETAGWTVLTAADGEEGLRFYEEHHSSIVLLLTDVTMPNINGLELADRVLEIDSQLPVLLMSGDARGAYRGLECVAKPFRSAELVARVSYMLKAKARSETTVSAA
jgi:DNA-binding response OmpR family regulator